MLNLINDILDFSKIEAGKVDLQETEFNVQSLLEDVINLLGMILTQGCYLKLLLGEPANLKGIDLLYCVNDMFRTLQIVGDHGRFRQILVNLIGKNTSLFCNIFR